MAVDCLATTEMERIAEIVLGRRTAATPVVDTEIGQTAVGPYPALLLCPPFQKFRQPPPGPESCRSAQLIVMARMGWLADGPVLTSSGANLTLLPNDYPVGI